MNSLQSNSFLIADPFLKDKSFVRSVVYLCLHNQEGSFGFIINKKADYFLEDLMADFDSLSIPVYAGGPVGTDTIHFLHQLPHLIPDSQKMNDNLFWGGDFDCVKELITAKKIDLSKIKFFIGYSGWSAGQLANEIEEKSWLTSYADNDIIFNSADENIWKKSIKLLGPEFIELINYPIDPELN
jgi:putative transcriptional regulator